MSAFTLASYTSAGALSRLGKEANTSFSALSTSSTRMLIPLYSDPSTQWTNVINANAYKNIDVVMENQSDLVDILVELSPLAVIKG